jgi:WD40 repeat protein
MRLSISTDSCVNSVSIHPDGKRVAAAMDFGIAMVVSTTMGEPQFYLSGHGGNIIRTIAYSPSGKRIATGALSVHPRWSRLLKMSAKGCDDKRLRVYEAENGSLLFGPFEIHADWIRSIAWSPDGQRWATTMSFGVMYLTHPTYI